MQKYALAATITLSVCIPVAATTKYDVKIVDRRDTGGNYTYVVPGYSNTNASVNCNATPNAANCNGQATTISTPGAIGSYQVHGATLTLQLPDGRLAVVNCNSKVNWTEMNTNTYRSCRIPPIEAVQAEFDGDKAKLKWSVSIDGKKSQSETYKILAVLDRPK
jgi:hypothetical protein